MTTQSLSRSDTGNSPSVNERIYVGIDVGYKEHVVAAIKMTTFNFSSHQDSWKRAKTLHFTSDAAGFKQLRRYLDKLSTKPLDFLILLEPTGGYYGMTLLMYLIS